MICVTQIRNRPLASFLFQYQHPRSVTMPSLRRVGLDKNNLGYLVAPDRCKLCSAKAPIAMQTELRN